MENLIRALAVTAELTGTEISAGAAKVMARDLAKYDEDAVLRALERCRREVRRMTLKDIIDRIDDGRPGPDEAWGMYPKDEDSSAVVSEEMQAAMRHAWPLLKDGDHVAARMAFREAYTKLVTNNRSAGIVPKWHVSLGRDVAGRETALVEAVEMKRLSVDHALRLAPPSAQERIQGLTAPTRLQIENKQKLQQAVSGMLGHE